MNAELDAQALDLRRAGASPQRIAAELHFKTARQADAAVVRALKAQATPTDPGRIRELELDRLDRLQTALWVKALRGDMAAVDRVTRIGEQRMRLAGAPVGGTLATAFATTVGALELQDADATLVAAGQRIAEKIDAAAATGDQLAETKALYLVPHLLNVLRELGATPAARDAVGSTAHEKAGDENDLATFKARRGIA